MNNGLNVLSLFDGISCGHIALERAGIKVNNYFASEIKPIAIKVTQSNYPNTIQLGDIRNIDVETLPQIDILMGGSPCQNFSSANLTSKNGLDGEQSKLFYEYLRILNYLKIKNPKIYFLLENVKMKKNERDIISNYLGVEPIEINSKLLSAQSRPRLYWTNIPNVSAPEDKGIKLNQILETGYSPLEKARCLLVSDSRPLTTPIKIHHRAILSFITAIYKDEKHYKDCSQYYNEHFKGMKAKDIVCNSDLFNGIRLLTTRERERLQTIPEGYVSKILSTNESADVLGDGWTVDVIAHIFKHIKNK